jgi:hypothetical protein
MRTFTLTAIAGAAAAAVLLSSGPATGLETPTTGQNGAPTNTCYSAPNTADSPGNAMNAPGSAFNPNGTSGTHYAGNAGTSSIAHANSTAAVSQYDTACLRVTAAAQH